jgi:peroxiredoxin Q/BCP
VVKKKVSKKKVVKKKAEPKKMVKKTLKKTKPPEIGSLAPIFELLDQDSKEVSLESFKGKFVLVYFYPRAMTPGCTVQACGLRDQKKTLTSAGVVVLGISPDKPASLKKFQERDKLNFDLLSDADHKVALSYGSWGEKKFMGRTFDGILRQSFLIDKQGKIAYVMSKVNTKTHADDILKVLENL